MKCDKFILERLWIMTKSKRINYFQKKRKLCDKDEKNASTLTKLKKSHENQEFNTMKNKSLKFLQINIMNLKIHQNVYILGGRDTSN